MSDIKKIKSLSAELVSKSSGTMVAPSEVIKKIKVLAPEAVTVLEQLMVSSKADSVRLKAALEILALAGINKENVLTIKTEVKDMHNEEIDTRLSDLLGMAAGAVLDSEIKDITPTEEIH